MSNNKYESSLLSLQGGDLDYMLKKLKSTNKILDESLIMDWFIQLTDAVHYIHDRYCCVCLYKLKFIF